MTRGKFIIIETYEKYATAHSSCEFNGDMYWDKVGHGRDVTERLQKVKCLADYYKTVLEFDEKNHNYQNEKGNYFEFHQDILFVNSHRPEYTKKPLAFVTSIDPLTIDFNKEYFEHWFSDYLYIKCIGDRGLVLISEGGKKTVLKPNDIAVVNFGTVLRIFTETDELPEEVKSNG